MMGWQHESIAVSSQPGPDEERKCLWSFLLLEQSTGPALGPDEARPQVRTGADHSNAIVSDGWSQVPGNRLNFLLELLHQRLLGLANLFWRQFADEEVNLRAELDANANVPNLVIRKLFD